MKILITGTAGFIGFHLAKKLLERGDTVVGIDNINDYYDVNLKYARLAETGISRNDVTRSERHPVLQLADSASLESRLIKSTKYPNYTFIKMNLEDRDELMQLFEREKFDKVCNLAAQAGVRYSLENPHIYVSSNIVGFMNILEACRHNNVKHLAYASSSSVYGNNTKMPLSTSDNVDHPISLYAATKKSNELMAHTYSHLFNLPTTGLRFFTVYGPWGRPDMALFLFTKAIIEGKPIQVFNNGNMVRDFTYVDDIIEGVTRVIDSPPITKKEDNNDNNDNLITSNKLPTALSSPPSALRPLPSAPYKIYNIGNSSPVPLIEFINAIEHHLGKTAIKEFLPMQPGDVPRTEADVTDLVENLGYRPNTPVSVGIGKFVEWYKQYFKL
ncbi:MAG TPA: NAD-dependent epimerase [Draconibacterium sp.]|nr:NAD-dependent epimerase [Draconibacterium sp.]